MLAVPKNHLGREILYKSPMGPIKTASQEVIEDFTVGHPTLCDLIREFKKVFDRNLFLFFEIHYEIC